ncbi:MAG: ribosome maturation factor RimP [Acidobacteria bacterium]|nr:ribosome maturation factor RimP [Acidobacteriota bacterium]
MDWLERVRDIAERVATSEGLELVDVEFLGRGPAAVLRIYIDKPQGITIADCENVSRQMSAILDVEDFISRSYTLEVSSPGLDRKLLKPTDYQRFAGKLVKIVLKVPRQGLRRYRGWLLGLEGDMVRLDTDNGEVVQINLGDIEKANLVVEFGKPAKPNKRS